MTCDNALFVVDSITVDGENIPIEQSTARIEGAARYESEVVPSGIGPDFTKRKRVATKIKAKVLFGPGFDPTLLTQACGAQIVLTDTHTGRRCRAGNCNFGSMGEIGDGSVDMTWNVLTPLQWL